MLSHAVKSNFDILSIQDAVKYPDSSQLQLADVVRSQATERRPRQTRHKRREGEQVERQGTKSSCRHEKAGLRAQRLCQQAISH